MDRIDVMRAFVRLVELGSFTRVSEELRVGQSTISKWLAALEEELEVSLLERTTRRQRVTAAGERFYRRAKDILAAYDEARAEASSTSDELEGRIRVSAPVVFGPMYVVPHVAKLMRRHPRLEIDLRMDDRYVDLIEEGIDVAIRVGVPTDSSFKARALVSTPRRIVASPGYLKRRGAPTRPRELGEHEFLLHTGLSMGATLSFVRSGRTTRVRVRGRLAANHSESLRLMARSGLGIAMLASWLVDDDVRAGRLVSVLEDYALPPAPIQALMAPSRFVHPRIRAFVEGFAQELRAGALGERGGHSR